MICLRFSFSFPGLINTLILFPCVLINSFLVTIDFSCYFISFAVASCSTSLCYLISPFRLVSFWSSSFNNHQSLSRCSPSLGRSRQVDLPALHPNQGRRQLECTVGAKGHVSPYPWVRPGQPDVGQVCCSDLRLLNSRCRSEHPMYHYSIGCWATSLMKV